MSDFVTYGVEGLPLHAIAKNLSDQYSVCAFDFDVKNAQNYDITLRLLKIINPMRDYFKLMSQPDAEPTDLDVECIEDFAFEFVNILTLRIGSVYDVIRSLQDNCVIMEYKDIDMSLMHMLDNALDCVVQMGKVNSNDKLSDDDLAEVIEFNSIVAIYWMYMIVESIEKFGLVGIYDKDLNPETPEG